MKYVVLFFLVLPAFLYSDSYYEAIMQRNAIEEQKNQLLYDENRIKNREIQLEYNKYEDAKRKEREEAYLKEVAEEKAKKQLLKKREKKAMKIAEELINVFLKR